MGRTKQTGRMDQARMQIDKSDGDGLQLRAVVDPERGLMSNGLLVCVQSAQRAPDTLLSYGISGAW